MNWLKTSYQLQTFKGFVHAVENGFIILQRDTTTPSINFRRVMPVVFGINKEKYVLVKTQLVLVLYLFIYLFIYLF